MITSLSDLTFFDQHNFISVNYGGQPVGNHNDGTPAGNAFKGALNRCLCFVINRAGGFV